MGHVQPWEMKASYLVLRLLRHRPMLFSAAPEPSL